MEGGSVIRSPGQTVQMWSFGTAPDALAPGVVLRDMASPGRTLCGAETVVQYLAGLLSAFAETRIEEERQSESGDTVTVEFLFRGRRQVASLGGIRPRGKDLALPMCAVYRVADERITEISLYYNARSIVVQLQG